jgi:hypothetical protein
VVYFLSSCEVLKWTEQLESFNVQKDSVGTVGIYGCMDGGRYETQEMRRDWEYPLL